MFQLPTSEPIVIWPLSWPVPVSHVAGVAALALLVPVFLTAPCCRPAG